MKSDLVLLLVSSFLLSLFLQKPVHAIKKSYIVYLGAHSHGRNPSEVELESATNSHYELLGSHLGSLEKAKEAIFYSYNRHINGFAAMLEEEEAEEIAKNPRVVSVFLNKRRKLHTTRSWQFLGLEENGIVPQNSLWQMARYGQDIIIGNLDTGVWPESKSFSEQGIGPIPSKWRGHGACQINNLDGSNRIPCNKKLIGARSFYKGYEMAIGKILEPSYSTARDVEGHGTHTLSTAGGNFVPGVSVLGIYGNGTAKGGSPKARVAAYKVCWSVVNETGGCLDADVLAGFEAAISDNVDVLSVSAGPTTPHLLIFDPFAIGSFHAVANGIVVVNSAGNEGPQPETVTSVAPWMISVGASTIDRSFTSYIELGNKKRLEGSSLALKSLPSHKLYPLINAEDAKLANANATEAKYCIHGTLDPKKLKGKIVFCLVGEDSSPTLQSLQTSRDGALGMIAANDKQKGNDVLSYPFSAPALNINFTDGEYIYSYIRRSKNPTASLTKPETKLKVKPSPMMAAFSSRGPNVILPSILKPDVTAPGVDIIAAYSEARTSLYPYFADSGTSMSCPQVAGIVGLLKTLYPRWSPAAIQSAIMTTATTKDKSGKPILDSSYKEATPFDYGSGHIQPDLAMDPGLVYDLKTVDYLNFLCASGYEDSGILIAFNEKLYTCPKSYNLADFNYPSITVLNLSKNAVSVSRTVTNVGSPSIYKVHVSPPKGISVTVEPSSFTFKKVGEKKKFRVILQSMGVAKHGGDYVFGELWWSDGKHKVRSPLVVKHK